MARRATAAEVRNLIGNLHRARHSLPEATGKLDPARGPMIRYAGDQALRDALNINI
jgi:hypothetical protein